MRSAPEGRLNVDRRVGARLLVMGRARPQGCGERRRLGDGPSGTSLLSAMWTAERGRGYR